MSFPAVTPPRKRAGFYIDGYNVYHAIADLKQNHLKWMCYRLAASCLAQMDEDVHIVKLFTALPHHFPSSMARMEIYLTALRTRGIGVYRGTFKQSEIECRSCKSVWKNHEEKETDVSLALHLLNDAKDGRIDVAYLITCDSDLAPAVRLVRRFCPSIELVHVSVPGMSFCRSINNHCHRNAKLTKGIVEVSLLPEHVHDKNGFLVATRPKEYRPPGA